MQAGTSEELSPESLTLSLLSRFLIHIQCSTQFCNIIFFSQVSFIIEILSYDYLARLSFWITQFSSKKVNQRYKGGYENL